MQGVDCFLCCTHFIFLLVMSANIMWNCLFGMCVLCFWCVWFVFFCSIVLWFLGLMCMFCVIVCMVCVLCFFWGVS